MMENIRLIKPYIDYLDVEQDFREVFASGVFTRGENVKKFAHKLGVEVGAKHTFLTTSATTALWVSLKALGIQSNDEVAISDFSFPATANVVEDLGAKPIFVDVNFDTFNMNVDDLVSKITKKTKAVIFVDAFGNPTGLHEIKKVCEDHGVPLVEDAACALGSKEYDISCGKIADITCFSFHPRKLLCTGEGGAITTDNDELAKWLESRLLHGANKTSDGKLEFSNYGFNFRMSELQAIMGIKQIKKIHDIICERTQTRNAYVDALIPLGFQAQKIGTSASHNVQSLVFVVPENIERDHLIDHLKQNSVEATIGTYCQSRQPYYKIKYDNVQLCSSLLEDKTITLPCYAGVPVEEVCQKIFDLPERC
jgi:perosamine synthetase